MFKLRYRDIGEGQPIVFIHGLGSTKESWEPQLPLGENYRLITPDLRGHGQTELEDDISMTNFAKDIIDLLEYLEIPSAYFCGLSLGGLIAQEINLQKPSIVKGLILCNTTYYVPYLAFGMVKEAKKHVHEEWFAREVAKRSLHNLDYLEEATNTFNIRNSYIEASKAAIGFNYLPFIPMTRKPILFIGGIHDKVTPLVNMYTMHNLSWNSTFIALESSHLSNIEKREEFNRAINSYMRRREYARA
jgi:3-oxoadipate enol-lactonase